MNFALPQAFFLLLLIPVVLIYSRTRRRNATLLYSSLTPLRYHGPTWRIIFRPVVTFLRILCLVLLIVALARPRKVMSEVRRSTEGIAIMAVIDHSSSMGELMKYDNDRLNRMEVVKRVLAEFVLGNKKDLPGRPDDLIGLVAFARYADTICPLVHAHDALVGLARQVDIVKTKAEDGTAIGDGIALAAARLHTLDTGENKTVNNNKNNDKPAYRIKSKIIILLTDGINNAGRRSPAEAARLARQWGIKIYAIGIGGDRYVDFFGEQMPVGPGIDEATLKQVASLTGGKYWRATDGDSLRQVYREIDSLEKSSMESTEYASYEEKFMPWVELAGLALLAELLLSSTLFRRAP